MKKHLLSLLVIPLTFVWAQENWQGVAYWHVWKKHSLYNIWLIEAAVTEPSFTFTPDEQQAYYTISTVYEDGTETFIPASLN